MRGHIFESGWVIAPCQPTAVRLLAPSRGDRGAEQKWGFARGTLSDACAAQAELKAAGLADVESDSWCDCLFLAQVDIKGWIPTWLGTWSTCACTSTTQTMQAMR